MTSPKIIIIAGPNGAGKTTFARSFLPEEAHCPRFINADLIAAGLSPFAPIAALRPTLQAPCQHLGEVRQCRRRTLIAGMGRKPMNTQDDIANAQDPDLRASLAAMQRAAILARKTAIQTGTSIVIVRDGVVVRVSAEELRENDQKSLRGCLNSYSSPENP